MPGGTVRLSPMCEAKHTATVSSLINMKHEMSNVWKAKP